ncbi:MAG: hypothetical protein ACLFTU_05475 [Puniceicoccaceae bacterium]
MGISDIIAVGVICLKLAPTFFLIGLGLRYLFYDPDAWNLDRIYVRYFRGRRRKNYRPFTQRSGLVLLILGLLYTWWIVWPMLEKFFTES